MNWKRIAALIGGAFILLTIVGNAMEDDPYAVRGPLISLAGALVGLMAGLLLRRRSDRRSFPLVGAILGAIVANWIGVFLGLQFPNADSVLAPATLGGALVRVTGSGVGGGLLYGGAVLLIIYGLKGPYRGQSATPTDASGGTQDAPV